MTDTDTDTAVEATEEVVDEPREALLAELRDVLGDAVVEHHLVPGRGLWVRVRPEAWVDVVRACRERLGLDFFDFLSGMDWRPSPWGRYEDTPFDSSAPDAEGDEDEDEGGAEEGGVGYAGGESHFQLMCHLYSTRRHVGVHLRVDLDPDYPELPTISQIYPGADWHEREAWEMFGFNFVGHPHLLHLYLPSDFEGFPLRKDHPLLSRVVKPWPGVVDVEPIPEHLEEELERQAMAAAEAAEGSEGGAP